MTFQSSTQFILGATTEHCEPDDKRIRDLFATYAKEDPTGETLTREEFLKFYYNAAKENVKSVHDNLEHHFIRKDLKKLSELIEETKQEKQDMPRFMISAEQS